ncbi:AAA family ATPase [Sulfurimonas sp. SWIR-19]|uniref:AAA family ATPase n=1 Tax=Sulfurimonas sp. SWIR-19 TaxID=2878390 RepID=UPI001CF0F5EC|nr:AAA family ATPase [Sulfurimonas sp. SWIR-19]UCM99366.1 AAA family ATPase [Sulfurimonas sp. SWIR-19]
MKNKIKLLKKEIAKGVIGHENMIDALLIGLITNGHILLEGVPGLAKTTAVNALSKALSLDFKRVQFTPDLLPSDIIGAEIYDVKSGEFKIKHGPVFTNLLLADEINRAPAKVQSALLEVMQERQVTIGDESFKIEPPFLVLATQNPIEQEGAYTLPEAQLDRFMFKVIVSYNTEDEEYLIAQKAANETFESIEPVLLASELEEMKEEVKAVYIEEELSAYIVRLIFATRDPKKYGLEELQRYIAFGASPRATINMLKAVKARAYLRGNDFVSPIDIALSIKDVLRHRIILSYDAIAEGLSSDDIIQTILESIEIP